MEQVPNIISTKDILYLSDIFEWNYTASKESYQFSLKTLNQELKDVFYDVYSIHKEICEDILDILNKGDKYE